MASEKPFGPTTRKLKEARREGKVSKAQLLTSSLALLAVALTIATLSNRGLLEFRILIEFLYLEGLKSPLTGLSRVAAFGLLVSLLLLAPAAVVAWVSELSQVGFCWNLTWKFSNPSDGVKRVFSGLKSTPGIALKSIIVCSFLIWFFSDAASLVGSFAFANSPEVYAARKFQEFTRLSLLVLLSLGISDYMIARRKFLKELSMSHQELREEYKDEEGDPHIKAARASFHRALALEEVIKRVRKAKVLIVERE